MVKCQLCKKKLNSLFLEINTCRCKGLYCHKHMNDHNCTFDYNELYKKTHKNEIITIKPKKIIKI